LYSEKNKPLISIIILNYNAGELLLNCVESVFKTEYSNFEVIVVDNASKDDSHKKCKERFENLSIIENKENLGYCEGNNIGIRQARGDFIVILNPDTIVDPRWLQELLSAYNEFGEGLYQPKLLSSQDRRTFNSAGNMIQLFGFGYSRGKGEIDTGQYDKPEAVGYASGACLFTSKKILDEIGLFDPFLFAYHDDLDLGWRAAQLGIKSYYTPRSIVFHAESFSFKWSPHKFFLLERNRHYCLLTHYSKTTFYKFLPSLILVEIAVFFFYLSRGMIRSKSKAYADIIRNRKHIAKRYSELQNKRKLSDKEIIMNFQDKIFVPKAVADYTTSNPFNTLIESLSKLCRIVM
jgi:GT2 family glycosyltransferase